MAVDPSGTYLYALQSGGGPDRIRRITIASQAVTTWSDATSQPLLAGANHITVDASNQVWVAVLRSTDNAIIRYPAGGDGNGHGGTPTLQLQGINGGFGQPYGTLTAVGGAFAISGDGYLYYSSGEDETATPYGGAPSLHRLPVSSLGPSKLAKDGADWGSPESPHSVFKGALEDLEFSPTGKLYVIWPGTDPAPNPPNDWEWETWRVDGVNQFTPVVQANAAMMPRVAFDAATGAAYMPCNWDSYHKNDCPGQQLGLLVRRDNVVSQPVPIAGGPTLGCVDGTSTTARMNLATGLAISPDGKKMYVADSACHAIRIANLPSVLVGGARGADEFGSRSQYCAQCDAAAWPVSLPWGVFYHSFDTISVPGRLSLDYSITYRSNQNTIDNGLGLGWSGSYGMSLSFSGTTATIREESGSAVSFVPKSGGGYDPQVPRTIGSFVDNGNGTYTFTRTATDTFTFEANPAGGYRLKRVTDPNGNYVDLGYQPASPYKLASATDSALPTRSLSFNWTGGHLTSIVDSAGGRQVSFVYAGNLMTNYTTLTGGVWTFEYDTAGGTNRMLTMLDPAQQSAQTKVRVTNHYDGSGRVDYQDDQNAHRTLFDYTGYSDATGAGTVVVTDPMGHKVAQTYSDNMPVAVTKGYTSAVAGTWTYQYDSYTGQPVRTTDPNGHATEAAYDHTDGHMGNLLWSKDALGDTTSFSYIKPGTGTYKPVQSAVLGDGPERRDDDVHV